MEPQERSDKFEHRANARAMPCWTAGRLLLPHQAVGPGASQMIIKRPLPSPTLKIGHAGCSCGLLGVYMYPGEHFFTRLPFATFTQASSNA